VHERSALLAGEDGLVDGGCVLLPADDEAGARSAEGFVGCGGGDVGVGNGRGMNSACDEAGNVGVYETPQPVSLDRMSPKVHIRDVRPLGQGG